MDRWLFHSELMMHVMDAVALHTLVLLALVVLVVLVVNRSARTNVAVLIVSVCPSETFVYPKMYSWTLLDMVTTTRKALASASKGRFVCFGSRLSLVRSKLVPRTRKTSPLSHSGCWC